MHKSIKIKKGLEKMLETTKERFKNLYSTKKDTIEWMLAYGTDFEKMQATIIKNVALGN